MQNHGRERTPVREGAAPSSSSSSSEDSPTNANCDRHPSYQIRAGSNDTSCGHGAQLQIPPHVATRHVTMENNDNDMRAMESKETMESNDIRAKASMESNDNAAPSHVATQDEGADTGPTTAANKGRLHYLIPPLISRGSFVSSSAMGGSERTSTRRSMSASVLGSFRPSENNSQTNSRRSFLLEGDEDGVLQRLGSIGVRGSTASEITTELQRVHSMKSAEGKRLSSCWFRMRCMRLQIWLFLEEPFLTFRASVLSCVMVIIIFTAVACSVYRYHGAGVVEDREQRGMVKQLDFVFNLVFVFDLVVRAWTFPMPWRFLKRPTNTIDVISILPFLVNEVMSLPTRVRGLGFLSWLSAFEAFLRLLKLSRYFWGWQLLFHAVADSFKALAILVYFLLLIAMSGSCLLYVFEAIELATQGDVSEVDCGSNGRYGFGCSGLVTIRTLPDAVHFCIISILGISTGPFYGMQAESVAGRATVCALMAFGMTFMAMPIAIVGSCFSQTWFDQDRILLLEMVRSRLLAQGFTPQDIRDVFDEVDQNRSGEIELNEFRTMIRTFNLRSLNATKCRQLFHYFDNDGDGVINFEDFALTLYPDLPVEESDDDEDNGQPGTIQEEGVIPRQTGSLSSRLTWSRLKKAGPSKNYMDAVVPSWASRKVSCSSSKASVRSTGSSSRAGPRGSQPQPSPRSLSGATQGAPAAAAASSSNARYDCEARGSCVSEPSCSHLSPEEAMGIAIPTIGVEASGDDTIRRRHRTRASQPSICSSICHSINSTQFLQGCNQPTFDSNNVEETDIDMLLRRIDSLEHRIDRRLERLANLFLRQGVSRTPATAFLTGIAPQAEGAVGRRHSDCRRPASRRQSPRPSATQIQHPQGLSALPAGPSASAPSAKSGSVLLLPAATTGAA